MVQVPFPERVSPEMPLEAAALRSPSAQTNPPEALTDSWQQSLTREGAYQHGPKVCDNGWLSLKSLRDVVGPVIAMKTYRENVCYEAIASTENKTGKKPAWSVGFSCALFLSVAVINYL